MPRIPNQWTAAVLAAALFAPAARTGEPPAADPVEALRAALRRPAADELARTADLTPAADALHSLGDLGRALLLDEWRDDDRKYPLANADREARDKVLARFEERARRALAGPDPLARQAAAILIGETAVQARTGGGAFDPAAVVGRAQVREHLSDLAPDLIKLLRDDNEMVRAAAARGLGKVQPEPGAALRALGRLLDPDEKEASNLARTAAAAAVAELLAAAVWDHGQGRRECPDRAGADAELLRVTAMVLGVTAKGLADREERVRRSCVDAVGRAADVLADRIPDPSGAPKDPARIKMWDQLRPLLVPLNQQLPAVAKDLAGPSAARLSACEALRAAAQARRRLLAWGRDDSVSFSPVNGLYVMLDVPSDLARCLDDADARVRLSAMKAIGVMGEDAESLQGPVAALLRRETDPAVRAAAVQALGVLVNGRSPDEAIEALAKALADGDGDVRRAVPAALVPYVRNEPSAKKVTEALVAALQDSDAPVRAAAAVALGRLGKPGDSARAALRKALDDPDPAVRLAAAAALLSGK